MNKQYSVLITVGNFKFAKCILVFTYIKNMSMIHSKHELKGETRILKEYDYYFDIQDKLLIEYLILRGINFAKGKILPILFIIMVTSFLL